MRIRSLVLPVLSAIAVGVLAYTLADHRTGGSDRVSNVPVHATAVTVRIDNFAFAPPALTVKVGTHVTFTNMDSAAHTATADQGAFDTGTLNHGKSMTVAFDKPGTFSYHCDFHAFMTATIKVVS
ncbi:MAG TPA: cupredoxin domain-containing protein [Solirubrobacteraceae bacterium]